MILLKLNIGCGRIKKAGYINVDIRESVEPDVVWDLEKFPYPWDTGSIEELFTSHTVEHVAYDKQYKMLKEFYRILKSGGKLIILCPDIEELFRNYIDMPQKPKPSAHPHFSLEHFLYGGQDYPDNFHKAGYTPTSMRIRLEQAGFVNIVISEHLRAEANKP